MMERLKEIWQTEKLSMTLGMIFFGLFLLSFAMPESLWGLHHVTFLPPFFKFGFPLAAIICFYFALKEDIRTRIDGLNYQKSWAWIATIVMAFLFHFLPIHNDAYGDAPKHMALLSETVTELDMERTNNLYSLNIFDTKNGEKTVLNAVEKISYYSQTPPKVIFKWIATIFGALFVWLWITFVARYINNPTARVIAWSLGILAPFIQLYFGHLEVYAPAMTGITGYLMLLILFLKEKKAKHGWLLIPVLFLCLKFHFVSVLLIPSLILAWLYVKAGDKFREKFTWKRIIQFVLVPMLLLGIWAYAFWFEDARDPRFLDGKVGTLDRLFLPVFSPEAPLDRYNLFSWNHLLDYFNMAFLWSSAGLFLLSFFLIKRKKVNWQKPETIILGLTLLLFVGLFFMVNPLLSMPVDFDLYSLTGPVLLVLVVTLLANLNEEFNVKQLLAPALALSIMTLPIVATNFSSQANMDRLAKVGTRAYKTYWIRSAGTIELGLDKKDKDYYDELTKILTDLKPYALKGNDVEYAHLLMIAGQYKVEKKEYEAGIKHLLESAEYYADYGPGIIARMDAFYRKGDFKTAYKYSKILAQNAYPSRRDAIRMALDCSVRAGILDEAKIYLNTYLSENPSDEFIERCKKAIESPSDEVVNEMIFRDLNKAFSAKDFGKAYEISLVLLEKEHPDLPVALSVSIHCALEAGFYDKAEEHCLKYVEIRSDDEFMNGILRDLQNGNNVEDLKMRFRALQK